MDVSEDPVERAARALVDAYSDEIELRLYEQQLIHGHDDVAVLLSAHRSGKPPLVGGCARASLLTGEWGAVLAAHAGLLGERLEGERPVVVVLLRPETGEPATWACKVPWRSDRQPAVTMTPCERLLERWRGEVALRLFERETVRGEEDAVAVVLDTVPGAPPTIAALGREELLRHERAPKACGSFFDRLRSPAPPGSRLVFVVTQAEGRQSEQLLGIPWEGDGWTKR